MLHRKIQGNEGNLSTETDMAKGRPPLEPRIAALEARMAEMEKQIERMRSAREVVAPMPLEHYEPLFNRWPRNGS